MSDIAQPATPEQREAAEDFIAKAKQQAMQEVQQNMQIEIQMRSNALSLAVEAHKGLIPADITTTATTFLKFLKQGESFNG
jgi:hypothetical protein